MPFESIRLVQGDTDAVSFGRGTYASRSAMLGGSALKGAADAIIEKGKPMAAHLLEAAAKDIEFQDGRFAVAGTDRADRDDRRRQGVLPAGGPDDEIRHRTRRERLFQPCRRPSPTVATTCEVEIDPETGEVFDRPLRGGRRCRRA